MYPVGIQQFKQAVMDMIIAAERCEQLVKISLFKQKKRYNIMLHKLSEKYIHVGNLETKVDGLEEEIKILIDMVREEQHNVQLLKEELNRSKNMVEKEKDISRIRAELQARIGGKKVSREEDIGATVIRTISSSPGADKGEEINDNTLNENIDEEKQNDMNKLIDDENEEHLGTEETGILGEDQNVLMDESRNTVSDSSSVEQKHPMDQEECNNRHNFFENAQGIAEEKGHSVEQVSNKQMELNHDNPGGISVNVSNSQYDDLETHLDKLLKTYGIKDQVDTNTKEKEKNQGVKEENYNSRNSNEKSPKTKVKETVFNDFDSVDRLRTEKTEKKVSGRKRSKRARDHVLKDITLDSEEPPRKKKNNRCGSCEGCSRSDCDECKACLDKTRNGGRNTVRQKCYRRKCTLAP